jgi:hypothetical protein
MYRAPRIKDRGPCGGSVLDLCCCLCTPCWLADLQGQVQRVGSCNKTLLSVEVSNLE